MNECNATSNEVEVLIVSQRLARRNYPTFQVFRVEMTVEG